MRLGRRLHLPPVEPPDEDLADLAEYCRQLRGYLTDAEHQLALLDGHLADLAERNTGTRAELAGLAYYGLEAVLGRERVAAWRQLVAAAETVARGRGLHL